MTLETENKYIAVFDAEYTAKTNEYKGIQEMIQCALLILPVVKDEKIFKLEGPIERYVAFTKTTYNKSLSDFIIGLTGIKKENVESGSDLNLVINDIIDLLNKYDIKSVYVWGPDYKILSYNLELIEYPFEKSRSFLNRFVDISETLSNMLGYKKTISQIKACKACGVQSIGTNHNAPDDAQNLASLINQNIQILREVSKGD